MFLKIILIILSFVCLQSAYSDNFDLKDQILQLDTKNFKKKITIIEKISQIEGDFSLIALKSILDGKLYLRKSDKKILLVDIINRDYYAFDFFNNTEYGIINKRKFFKLMI